MKKRKETCTRTFRFRIAMSKSGETLEARMRSILREKPLAKDRRREVEDDNTVAINASFDEPDFVGWQLCHYSADDMATFLEEDDKSQVFEFHEVPGSNEKQRLSNGVAYVAARGNAVVVCGSNAIRAKDVETVINLFLLPAEVDTQNPVLPVSLALPMPTALRGQYLSRVNKITLKQSINLGFTPIAEEENSFLVEGEGKSKLTTLMQSFGFAVDSDLRASGPHELSSELVLAIPYGAREAGMVLDKVARVIEGEDAPDFIIETANGTFTKEHFHIKRIEKFSLSKGVPVAHEVWVQMKRWLEALRKKGQA